MIVVDASVWVSVLLQQDANHSQSRAWARVWSQRLRTFAVPTLFLAELSGVLQRRGSTSEFASRQIDTILTSPTFTVHELTLDLGREAATIAFHYALRGADAIYIAQAVRLGVPLITWDQEQLTRRPAYCQVLTPSEALNEL